MYNHNQRNKSRDYSIEIEFIKQYMVRNFDKKEHTKKIQNEMKLRNKFIKSLFYNSHFKTIKRKLYYSYKKRASIRVIAS